MIKKWSRFEILLLVASLVIFFITRLYHLQAKFWPIFTDEAIYVNWAQQGFFEPLKRLTSLSDGKQPLFIWLITLVMQVIRNPLLAGRLVSAGSGLVTLGGLYFLTYELFKKRLTGIISVLLYTLFPLALIHNRLALYESLTGALFIWGVYFSVLLARNLKTETAFELGFIWGAGILTKTSGFISFYLIPTTILFLEKTKKDLVRWAGLSLVAIGLSCLYYSVLLLSPDFWLVNEKNKLFLYSFNEALGLRFFPVFIKNIAHFSIWMETYFTWPWIILAILSFAVTKYRKAIIFLWLTFGIPYLALAWFGKLVYPRYLFFFSLALIPLIAEMFIRIADIFKSNKLSYVLIFLSLIFVSYSDFKILTDFVRAPIPEVDLFQYVNGWPSGGGVNEIVNYLERESTKGTIYVYSEGIYGSLPTTVINIYFRDNANVKHQGLDKIGDKIPPEILSNAKASPVYLILNQTQTPLSWPVELVARYQKGIGDWYIRLYKVK